MTNADQKRDNGRVWAANRGAGARFGRCTRQDPARTQPVCTPPEHPARTDGGYITGSPLLDAGSAGESVRPVGSVEPVCERLPRHGASQEEALSDVAPALAQQLERVAVLDPFADDPEGEVVT